MKIKKIVCKPVSIPLINSFQYSGNSLKNLDYCIIEIIFGTEFGDIKGVGECSVAPNMNGETQTSVKGFFNFIEKKLIETEISTLSDISSLLEEIEKKIPKNKTAKAGLDMALLDGLGKLTNKPVYSLLGKQKQNMIPYQYVIPFLNIKEPQKVIEKIKNQIKNGITNFKLKVGQNDNYDLKIVEIVRSIDPNIKISVDVNQGWKTFKHAKKMIKKMKKFNIVWFEQPVYYSDWDALSKLKSLGIKIMADEALQSFEDCKEFFKHYTVDMVNIKIAKCGGLIEAKKIAELCKKKGVDVFIGSMIETSIGTNANLHLSAIVDFVQTDVGAFKFVEPSFVAGITEQNNKIKVPELAGLGCGLK